MTPDIDDIGDSVRPALFQVPPEGKRNYGNCRSCEAEVIWIRTKNARSMPLSVKAMRQIDGDWFAPAHFADCPDADKFRRPR